LNRNAHIYRSESLHQDTFLDPSQLLDSDFMPSKLPDKVLSLVRRPNRLLVAVCLFINGIVLTNAVLNDPYSGPDYAQHLRYVSTLARLHLPTPLESGEM
jgi:hypothetical protein